MMRHRSLIAIMAPVLTGVILIGCDIPDTSVKMTPEMLAYVEAVIRAQGYQCPRAGLATAEGPHPDGNIFKIWCGPADEPGMIYPHLVYRLNSTTHTARPWRDE